MTETKCYGMYEKSNNTETGLQHWIQWLVGRHGLEVLGA